MQILEVTLTGHTVRGSTHLNDICIWILVRNYGTGLCAGWFYLSKLHSYTFHQVQFNRITMCVCLCMRLAVGRRIQQEGVTPCHTSRHTWGRHQISLSSPGSSSRGVFASFIFVDFLSREIVMCLFVVVRFVFLYLKCYLLRKLVR